MAATIIPLVFFLYQIIIDWVNLFPWNDIWRKNRLLKAQEFIINYLPLLLIAYAYSHYTPSSLSWGMGGSILYLIGHIIAWWKPYFLGASPEEKSEYKMYFERTYKFLPAIDDNPVPDAQHVVLGIICLIMTILNTVIFFQYFKTS